MTVFATQNEPLVRNGEKSIILLNRTQQYSECVTVALSLLILTATFYSLEEQRADSNVGLSSDKLFLTLGDIMSCNCCTKIIDVCMAILLLHLLTPERRECLNQCVHSCKLQTQCKLHSEVCRGA